jgi:hypothetical protein
LFSQDGLQSGFAQNMAPTESDVLTISGVGSDCQCLR